MLAKVSLLFGIYCRPSHSFKPIKSSMQQSQQQNWSIETKTAFCIKGVVERVCGRCVRGWCVVGEAKGGVAPPTKMAAIMKQNKTSVGMSPAATDIAAMTWLEAAEHILKLEGPEMHIRDLTERVMNLGMVNSHCRTSLETLLYRQVRKRQAHSCTLILILVHTSLHCMHRARTSTYNNYV